LDPPPDLFIHTGDLLYTTDVEAGLFLPYRRLMATASLVPAHGNHDVEFDGGALPRWEDLFFPPVDTPGENATNYSFDWGSAHFATIDTGDFHANGPTDDLDASLAWLRGDLERARAAGARWLILYLHEPVFTLGAYGEEAAAFRPHILPVVDDLAVDLVISGHDHNYQRSHPVRGEELVDLWQDPAELISPRGTVFVITGGGGGVLYGQGPPAQTDGPFIAVFRPLHHHVELEVEETKLELRAIATDPDGRGTPLEIDAFTIRKDMPRPFRFLRGDTDGSGAPDLGDAIAILNHLFQGEPLGCAPIGDADGSGQPLDLADPVYLLNHLFAGGPPLAAPYPECGLASDEDAGCVRAGC
jgi:hypothetical protein